MPNRIIKESICTSEEIEKLEDYYIKSATSLMLEYYTSDSYFYDFIEHTASTDYIYDRVDKGDCSRLFLVPVDFHF